jgi:hypothetical protein
LQKNKSDLEDIAMELTKIKEEGFLEMRTSPASSLTRSTNI